MYRARVEFLLSARPCSLRFYFIFSTLITLVFDARVRPRQLDGGSGGASVRGNLFPMFFTRCALATVDERGGGVVFLAAVVCIQRHVAYTQRVFRDPEPRWKRVYFSFIKRDVNVYYIITVEDLSRVERIIASAAAIHMLYKQSTFFFPRIYEGGVVLNHTLDLKMKKKIY